MPPTPAGRAAPPPTPYRRDLDGLRGIAIALVVLFHVYVGRVSGGVDVFLLLSGLFFLGSQIRNADRPHRSINPWWSIWRTARRLLPGLLTVLAATAALVLWRVPSMRTIDNARQLAASVLYFQNWELAAQARDYRAAGADSSPLQHLWSMSVQGQFYLGAILLVSLVGWVVRRRNRRRAGARPWTTAAAMTPILAAVTIASFGYAWWLHGVDQPLNYYSTWSRLWELGLGALLGLVIARVHPPRRLAAAAAALGVAMIAVTGLIADGAHHFPGPLTLFPLTGAALVVVSRGRGGMVSAALGSRVATWFGDIAYALYLWHWPLLIIAVRESGREEPTAALGTAVVAVSVLLAWGTHRLIERPLMQRGTRPDRGDRVLAAAWAGLRTRRASRLRAVAAVALLLIAGSLVSAEEVQRHRIRAARVAVLDPADYPGARVVTEGADAPAGVPYRPAPDLADSMWPRPAWEGCLTRRADAAEAIYTVKRDVGDGTEPCVYGDPEGPRTMLLVGASHSEQWFPPLDAVAREEGFRLIPVLRPGCPVSLQPGSPAPCDRWSQAVVDYIAENPPDLVVTTASRPGSARHDFTPEGYLRFWDALHAIGVPFLAIRDTPWFVDARGEKLRPTECVADGGDPDACGAAADWLLTPFNPAEEFIGAYPGSTTVDFDDVLCPDGWCPAVLGNIFVYRDDNHLTDDIAASLTPEFRRRVAPVLRAIAETGR
ncbi:acyltransferase family protein [Corynebacterium sphenisci]|uniref:acyltransferase family protein n=1 Tax=Corynebacterium sphenisci TaxID=191493 RepID=UPI0026DFFF05|nr:acyltransferase family protein [Corynebacterium sphenisci]MDO5731866.1 acyltransferase family protein [Corynebacterium sphenisci]